MDKKEFPKLTKIVDVGKDLGIEGYEGVEFSMWRDPSRASMLSILTAFVVDADALEADEANQFFQAVTDIVADSNVDGISFGTIEETKESFDNDQLPWGFVFNVVVTYVSTLINESDTLKKALGLSKDPETSGESKNEVE